MAVNWTTEYNFAASPESNNFARVPYVSPATVTLQTTGPAAGRRITVTGADPSQGMAFVASSVPNLQAGTGATAEAVVAVTGTGDAGFEMRFITYFVGICIFTDRIELTLPGPDGQASGFAVIPTPSNAAATTVRMTVDGAGTFNLYRNGVLIDGPRVLLPAAFLLPSFQFWGEGAGTQTFTALRLFTGGADAT